MNSLVFYTFTKENYKILVDLSPMEDAVKHQLYLELNQIILLLTAASTASLILFGLLAIYLSHKTAGPLYRLKKEFKEIHSGKRGNKIFLREGDDFQEVMDDFNQVIDYLNKPN
jgi:signal transduction histidine kinase